MKASDESGEMTPIEKAEVQNFLAEHELKEYGLSRQQRNIFYACVHSMALAIYVDYKNGTEEQSDEFRKTANLDFAKLDKDVTNSMNDGVEKVKKLRELVLEFARGIHGYCLELGNILTVELEAGRRTTSNRIQVYIEQNSGCEYQCYRTALCNHLKLIMDSASV